MKRIRITEKNHDYVTYGKIYEAIGPDKDGDYACIDDNGYAFVTDGSPTVKRSSNTNAINYELVQFEPGTDSYCIRIHDQRHYEFVWALLKDLGYRGHPAGWDAPYKPSYTWLALNDMDILPASKFLTHPVGVTYEITTDDLIEYEPSKQEDTIKQVMTEVFGEKITSEALRLLKDLGYEFVEREDTT